MVDVSVAAAEPVSTAQVDSSWYSDPNVDVVTMRGRGTQELAGGFQLVLGVTVDRIRVGAPVATEPYDDDDEEEDDKRVVTAPAQARPALDAQTGASSVVLSDAGPEWRFEGGLGVRYRRVRDVPVEVGLRAVGSTEDDYGSFAAIADGLVELRTRTVTLGGFAGAGRDRLTPLDDVAPDSSSDRWFGGLSAGLVASRTVMIYSGVSATYQRGTLSSPYRMALVGATEVPEVLPGDRLRVTAFVQSAWSFADGAALHARLGGYADTWRVRALIPELAIARELGAHALATVGYRLYRQSAASFHRPDYAMLEPWISGDRRLASLVDHTGSAELAWAWESEEEAARTLTVSARYAMSLLTVDEVGATPEVGHIVSVGASGSY
jgi:hypothetical protein